MTEGDGSSARAAKRGRATLARGNPCGVKLAVALLALVLCVPVAGAQPGGGSAKPGAQPDQTRREKVKKRIRALRAYTLTEELSLDEQTAGKLFPVLARFDDEFDKLLLSRADIQRRLADAADKNAKVIDKVIDEAVANQRAFWDIEDKRLGELRKILSSAQTARLLIVLPALERKIQNQLQKAIGGGPGGHAKTDNPARKALDDDDDVADPPPKQPPRKPEPARAKCDPFSSMHKCN